eukprot:3169228-Pleurochrysis_carterae.AAC.1
MRACSGACPCACVRASMRAFVRAPVRTPMRARARPHRRARSRVSDTRVACFVADARPARPAESSRQSAARPLFAARLLDAVRDGRSGYAWEHRHKTWAAERGRACHFCHVFPTVFSLFNASSVLLRHALKEHRKKWVL